MKKIYAIIIAFMIIMSLSACGKSEAAQKVDNLILSIGEVSLSSKQQIIEAEKEYALLEEKDQGQVESISILEESRQKYDQLKNMEDAQNVENLITAIGAVSLDSSSKIETARKNYNNSSEEVKNLVGNLSILESAEIEISRLRIEKATALIDEIGTVALDKEDTIQAAQEYYDSLNRDESSKVENADLLRKAKNELDTLKDKEVQKLMNKMILDEDKVNKIKFYYPSVFPKFADIRCYVLPYLGCSSGQYYVNVRYNYTNNDWIFFDKVTFAVDNQRYTKTFDYFDAVHLVGNGKVVEYTNQVDLSKQDIDMLWEIVNSKETIVRFEGDEFYYDHTITANDKQAISDILTVYEAKK